MLILYHFNLCPLSRCIRLILNEFEISAILKQEEFWNSRKEFTDLHPSGSVPLLIIDRRLAISGVHPILEFLIESSKFEGKIHDESSFDSILFGESKVNLNQLERIQKAALVRSTLNWFNVKFHAEVTDVILTEKIIKPQFNNEMPNSIAIRKACRNLLYHLEYIEYLLNKMCGYLCGDRISIADFAAASHLSVLDFLNMIDWQKIPVVKQWYSLIKSRPSFRPLLHDTVKGISTNYSYKNLDF